jgi:hypothetical protein
MPGGKCVYTPGMEIPRAAVLASNMADVAFMRQLADEYNITKKAAEHDIEPVIKYTKAGNVNKYWNRLVLEKFLNIMRKDNANGVHGQLVCAACVTNRLL